MFSEKEQINELLSLLSLNHCWGKYCANVLSDDEKKSCSVGKCEKCCTMSNCELHGVDCVSCTNMRNLKCTTNRCRACCKDGDHCSAHYCFECGFKLRDGCMYNLCKYCCVDNYDDCTGHINCVKCTHKLRKQDCDFQKCGNCCKDENCYAHHRRTPIGNNLTSSAVLSSVVVIQTPCSSCPQLRNKTCILGKCRTCCDDTNCRIHFCSKCIGPRERESSKCAAQLCCLCCNVCGCIAHDRNFTLQYHFSDHCRSCFRRQLDHVDDNICSFKLCDNCCQFTHCPRHSENYEENIKFINDDGDSEEWWTIDMEELKIKNYRLYWEDIERVFNLARRNMNLEKK